MLSQKGIEVIVAAVPASGSIEARAERLAESIAEKASGKSVNIIAYVISKWSYSNSEANEYSHSMVELLPVTSTILALIQRQG